jgi:hypothetical protein
LIDEVGTAVWKSRPCQRGHCIDDEGQIVFVRPQSLFSLFAIINIGASAVPSHDFARFVAERLGANEKPAIHAIMAAKTRLDLVWFS